MHASPISDLFTSDELKQWRQVADDQYQGLLRLGMPVVHTPDGVRHSKADVDRWFGVVPPGAPPWVKPERIAETIRVWQPRYKKLLTPEDALEMLINVRALLDVLLPLK